MGRFVPLARRCPHGLDQYECFCCVDARKHADAAAAAAAHRKHEAAKATKDLLRYGTSVMLNGEHIPLERVRLPAAPGCFRCVTPKKCAIHGCSPGTWAAELDAGVPHA